MQKTRLGISVGLMGALIYFFGLISITPMVLLAGYVLICEENEWLKNSTVKALLLVVSYYLLTAILGLGDNIFGVINQIFSLVHLNLRLDYPLSIDSLITTIAVFTKNAALLLLGFKALSQGSMNIPVIDKMVHKNM